MKDSEGRRGIPGYRTIMKCGLSDSTQNEVTSSKRALSL